MGGSLSSGALGLYYEEDPSGKKRKAPYVVKAVARDCWQVCMPTDTKLVKIVAECLDEDDAQLILMQKLCQSARKNRRKGTCASKLP